jgi:hypothetical protein
VIGHFATINRKFAAGWNNDAMLHIVTREGYWKMAEVRPPLARALPRRRA